MNKENNFTNTILEIRKNDHENGRPFLILDPDLPNDQAYYEFKDGTIKIGVIDHNDAAYQVRWIKTLKPADADKIRSELGI